MKLLIVAFLIGGAFHLSDCVPTCAQITTMGKSIRTALQGNHGQDSYQSKAVRLGFHDCVGGCNGCINFNNPDNNGLDLTVAALTSSYNDNGFNAYCSLADFFALSAVVAIQNAVGLSNRGRSGKETTGPCPNPCFAMKWGRKTAANCLDETSTFPSPTMSGDAMFQYFQDEFGFSRAQVVALMGAHSFGGADYFNSGYKGKWTGIHYKGISEEFYSVMLNSTLSHVNTNVDYLSGSSSAKWQYSWVSQYDTSDTGFMLNTDFELLYDLTLDSNGKTTCNLNPTCGITNSCSGSCAMASTFSQAYAYSQNCTAFMTDFVSVVDLMLQNGYASDELTTTDCSC